MTRTHIKITEEETETKDVSEVTLDLSGSLYSLGEMVFIGMTKNPNFAKAVIAGMDAYLISKELKLAGNKKRLEEQMKKN